MRTTLDIDDRSLDALMARSPGLSKTKAIERAIDQYVKTNAYERAPSPRRLSRDARHRRRATRGA
jgi:hypothetical protein